MINLCIVCADSDLAQQVASGLRDAGASHVEVLEDSDLGKEQNKSTRNNRHIFIVQSPQEKLLTILPSELSEQAFTEDLSAWYQKQSDLMSAYEAQRSTSILITYGLIENDFAHLVQLINKKWRQRLNETFPDGSARLPPRTITSTPEATVGNQKPLVGYLVQGLIEQTPNLRQMQTLIDHATDKTPVLFDVFAAMGSYREDSQRGAKRFAEIESTKQQNKDLETQLKDAREEGELLFTQLHQVQEELESYFLKLKDAESLHATQQQTLKSELDATQQRNKDLEGKLRVAQEESQNHAKRIAELEAQHQTLKNELASMQQRNNDLDAKLKDATTESELLLVQLHQVQEELENYFLKFKDAENCCEMLQHRRRKMLKSYPDYADYAWVGVEPKGESNVLQWHFKDLESAGVSRNEVVFETFIEAGLLGVRFHKTPNVVSQESSDVIGDVTQSNAGRSLLYWPKVAQQLDHVDCIPAGQGDVKALRAAVLKGLSASDFSLLKLIPKLVMQTFDERPIEGVDREQLKLAAMRLQEVLDRLPLTVRFDGLKIKNHQVNPDYEHLWMVFENLQFKHQQWPKFEMRLGASKIKGGDFSHYVKIEIPLIDGQIKPFESWFEESVDDFGAKWELRFDLKKRIMDTRVWSELKNEEQSLIKGLLNELIQTGLQQIESDMKQGERAGWDKAFGQCVGIMG